MELLEEEDELEDEDELDLLLEEEELEEDELDLLLDEEDDCLLTDEDSADVSDCFCPD